MLGDKNAVNILVEKLDAIEGKVRKEAVQAIGDLKDKGAMEPVKKYYNESSEEERIWATYALIKLGQKDLIHTLEDNLKEEVFISAINVAGDLKLKESVPLLLELLQNSRNINIKIEIIKSLAEIGGEEIQEELNKYYEKSSGQERIWLIYALAKMKDRSKVKIILDLLSKNVRKASAIALGRLGNSDSAEVLVKALKSDDKDVRYNVVRALEKLNNEKVLACLKKSLEEEKEAHIKLAIDDAICELEKGEAL
jgi:HEAT repeat protein